jgi:hypothetical protein
MHKHSTYEQLGLPGHIGEIFFLISLALTLAPYFPGMDFGALKVPALPDGSRKTLKLVAPIALVVTTLSFFPFWPEPTGDIRSAVGDYTGMMVVFKNSSNRYVNLDWLDYDGKVDLTVRRTFKPGDSEEIRSYVSHVWRFSDANTGQVLRTVVIGQNTRLVEYRQFSSWFWISASAITVFGVAALVWSRLFR